MNLRLIIALVADEVTAPVMEAARTAGATGATTLTGGRGEGLKPEKTFFGLDLIAHRDMLLFIVAAPKAREILEAIAKAGEFDERPGTGLAFELAIEDAVGLRTQLPTILDEIESQI